MAVLGLEKKEVTIWIREDEKGEAAGDLETNLLKVLSLGSS